MINKKRNELIKVLYAEGNFTYNDLAKQFGISIERVRQIINPVPFVLCKKHKYQYLESDGCLLHLLDETYAMEMSMTELMEKLHRLQQPDRRQEVVYERKLIMKILKNKYKLNSQFISRLFKQDITTVKHHLGER